MGQKSLLFAGTATISSFAERYSHSVDTQIQFAGGSAENCLRSADLWGEREYKIKDFKLAVYTKCLRTYLPDFKLPRKRDVGWGHMRNDANGIHAVDIFPCINLLSCWWLDN